LVYAAHAKGRAMSLPEMVQFHKITIPQLHALYPYLDPNRPHELLDGQILVLPLAETPHRIVRNHLYQAFFRQDCLGLHVWPGGCASGRLRNCGPT
jgi:hypothetical protein